MKHVLSTLLLIAVLLCFAQYGVKADTGQAPTRTINLVYDDSGSMINTNNQNVDTWCQAKYAMEVFASMLGPKDTMNVYVMSDFRDSNTAGPRIILNGSEGSAVNVAKIHNMLTRASRTPFGAVRKAYSDLIRVTADQKWLVVLTDGQFEDVDSVDEFFLAKQDDVRVMFMAMGKQADGITQNESKNIFFEHAENNSEILNKLTSICTRIFNSDKLDVDVSSAKFEFDIPMNELVVFAQGANVSINAIQTQDGVVIRSSTTPVTVKYSEQAALNYDDFIIDRELQGSIATFRGNFEPGGYKVDVTGAETIEIYYKPDVRIAAYLLDENGNEVTDMTALAEGDYIISFGFVGGESNTPVGQSSLLGDVVYKAVITNNGVTHERVYESGDSLTLSEGSLRIDAEASYLDYHSTSTTLEYRIFKDKTIEFALLNDNIEYILTETGIENSDEPIMVEFLVDGRRPSADQWSAVTNVNISANDADKHNWGSFIIEKSQEPGVLLIYPVIRGSEPTPAVYGRCSLSLNYHEKMGDETWSGKQNIAFSVDDTRAWVERNRKRIIFGSLLLFALAFILSYMPFIKCYLPRKLKKFPKIECEMRRPGIPPVSGAGEYKRNWITTLIPLCPEYGTIDFVPASIYSVPPLKVCGARGQRMHILNVSDYAGNEDVTFNGSTIKAGAKKIAPKGAGLTCSVSTRDVIYTCKLSKE